MTFAERMEERKNMELDTFGSEHWLRFAVLSGVDAPTCPISLRKLNSRPNGDLNKEMSRKINLWRYVGKIVERMSGTFHMNYEETDMKTIVAGLKHVYGKLCQFLVNEDQLEIQVVQNLLDTVVALYGACQGNNIPFYVQRKLYKLWFPLHGLALVIASSCVGADYDLIPTDPAEFEAATDISAEHLIP